jgi:hypothetical protein
MTPRFLRMFAGRGFMAASSIDSQLFIGRGMAARPKRSNSAYTEQLGTPLARALGQADRGLSRGVHLRGIGAPLLPTMGELSWGERLNILDALAQVIDGLYAHLPLKRALYGFDPIRSLAHLRTQVPLLNDLQFHRELTTLMNRLRDAHTQYSGPDTIAGAVARLPFLVETWGPADARRFVVSKVSDRRLIRDPAFKPGVTLQWWNGVPFDRAVDLHAESETGGRPDARCARALTSLTFRSLEYGPPPNEHWVDVGYVDLKGKARSIRLKWHVVCPNRAPIATGRGLARMRRGIDPAAEAVRRAKKLMFNRTLWAEERPSKAARRARISLKDRYKDAITARTVRTTHGTYGYLRIWSFDVDDDQSFIDAAIAWLRGLPDRGLIIDLRDNPGGFIWAAERLLQLFTPNDVVPTKFALRATPLTAKMAAARFNQEELGPWADSLEQAPSTGEPYSVHLPITSFEQCNDRWQHYGGPVVVVVDANTYSSGDLFAAGIVDNRIGPVVCIGEATGAGGANVWESQDVVAAMQAADISLAELASGVNFTLSVRRAVRSGDADGVLIEDSGIAGQPYEMTRRDIFAKNQDLIDHCGAILAHQPRTQLSVRRLRGLVAVTTTGLDHVDVYSDGHPVGAGTAITQDGTVKIQLPRNAGTIDVVGFSQHVVRQRRRLPARR